MKRMSLEDFTFDLDRTTGDLYAEASFEFDVDYTFELDGEGYLYFNDLPPWEANYFYFENGN